MHRRRFSIALLMALAGAVPASAVAAPHGRHAANARPQAMVLQLGDLPTGFAVQQSETVSNAELSAGDPPKNYRKLGRLTGFDVTYEALGVGGLTAIDSFASIYKTGAGARSSLALSLAQVRKHGGSTFIPLTGVVRLGSAAHLYVTSATVSGTKVDLFIVAWQHGTVFAEVMGAGRSGTVDPTQVVGLAEKQEARIERSVS